MPTGPQPIEAEVKRCAAERASVAIERFEEAAGSRAKVTRIMWSRWLRRLGWLLAMWIAGVLCLTLVSLLLRQVLRLVGLHS